MVFSKMTKIFILGNLEAKKLQQPAPKVLVDTMYAFHDLRGGSGRGLLGLKKILHLDFYFKNIEKVLGGDRREATGLFIRVGFFARGFSGLRLFCLRLFCLRLFSLQAFL